jgi:hypothetical protein
MRRTLLVLFILISTGVALTMAWGTSGGSNIDKREKYWEEQISKTLKTGATKEELKDFVTSRGQSLNCYQNYDTKQDECDFEDMESKGGTRSMPVRLVVTFSIKDGLTTSHKIATKPIIPVR